MNGLFSNFTSFIIEKS